MIKNKWQQQQKFLVYLPGNCCGERGRDSTAGNVGSTGHGWGWVEYGWASDKQFERVLKFYQQERCSPGASTAYTQL